MFDVSSALKPRIAPPAFLGDDQPAVITNLVAVHALAVVADAPEDQHAVFAFPAVEVLQFSAGQNGNGC